MMADKTNTGGPAATLVGILTLMFIFYILLLPADERRDLLDTNNSTTTESERVLLNETPGHLTSSQKSVFDHLIPNIYLSESRNAAVLANENPFTVRNGRFSQARKIIQFSI